MRDSHIWPTRTRMLLLSMVLMIMMMLLMLLLLLLMMMMMMMEGGCFSPLWCVVRPIPWWGYPRTVL